MTTILKKEFNDNSLVVSDDISTKGIKTTLSSKMLSEYKPIFDATVVELLKEEGYEVVAKTSIPEFGVGKGEHEAAKTVEGTKALGVVADSGGEVYFQLQGTELYGLVPTYGLVSRYGVVPVMSSAATVGIISHKLEDIGVALEVVAKHDVKDSNSYPQGLKEYSKITPIKEEAVDINDTKARDLLKLSHQAYQILSSGEFATNMERYDGIVYGYRSEEYTDVDSLYKNSRSESLGEEVKEKILLGNYFLLDHNYDEYYEQAMKARRLIKETLEEVLESNEFLKITEEYLQMIKLAGLPYGLKADVGAYTTRAYNEDRLIDLLGGVSHE